MNTAPSRSLSRFRPTPSLVVASVALFTALGGGAYAAVSLPAHSVGTRELRSAAVTSAKVRDHSLQAADFRPGQLPTGPKGDTGPKGATGPKGDAGTAKVHVVSRTMTIASNTLQLQNAICPAGEVATGGGGHVGAGGIYPAGLTRSEPHTVNGTPDGWQVIASNTTNAGQEFTVYAICAPAA
jgi:hypothetical protein